jgi:hypothetical protein
MPDLFGFLHQLKHAVLSSDPHFKPPVARPDLVDAAIFEAISTSNHYMIDLLTLVLLSADGENLLKPAKPEHFIAAAKRLDIKAIEILLTKVSWVFPFDNVEVVSWMQHAKTEAQSIPCSKKAFINYVKYVQGKLQRRKKPEPRSSCLMKPYCECHHAVLYPDDDAE